MDNFPPTITQEEIETAKTLMTLKIVQVSAFFSMPFTTIKNYSQ